MLFDAIVKVKLPGNNEADAIERLKSRLPHWEHEVCSITPCDTQPASISGTLTITLPSMEASNGR